MGFVDALQLKGRVVDLYMSNGIKLDAARVKDVSPWVIQVTHKDRTKYVNPEYVVMIEVG
jgi:sRNA-binding regulator protein Hfq